MKQGIFLKFAVLFIAFTLVGAYLFLGYYPPELKGKQLVQLDSLEVGDDVSEALHAYMQGRNSAWEAKTPDADSDGGTAGEDALFAGSEVFIVTSVPKQDLVVLRRYDAVSNAPSARLYAGVDDIGFVNFSLDKDGAARYRQLAFVVPGRYVSGDRTLLTLRYIGGSRINSTGYWFYAKGDPLMDDMTRLAFIAATAAFISLILVFRKAAVRTLFYGRVFPTLPFAIILTLSLLFSHYVYNDIPHIPDSRTYLFQARLLLQGKTYLNTAAELNKFFSNWFIFYKDGRLLGKYPLGYPLLLAAGEALGLGRFVNPLFGGLCAVLVYYLGRRVYGENTGKYASLLAASSFPIIIHAAEFTSHVPMMFFMLVFQLFFLRALENNGLGDTVVSGIALGCGVNIRPYTALAVFTAYAAYFVYAVAREKKMINGETAVKAVVLASILTLSVAFFAIQNKALTGSYTKPGYLYYDRNDRPGFDVKNHTPGKAVAYAWNYAIGLAEYLIGGGRGLVLMAAFALLIYRRPNRFDCLFTCVIGTVILFYSAYHHQEFTYGPRYILEVMPLACLLVTRAFANLNDERLLKAIALAALCSTVISLLGSIDTYTACYGADGRFNRMFEVLENRFEGNTVVFADEYAYQALLSRNRWDFANDRVVYARHADDAKDMEFLSLYFPGYDCRVFAQKDGMYALEDCPVGYEKPAMQPK